MNKNTLSEELFDKITAALEDTLPHGSGIDYDWKFYRNTDTSCTFYATNSYHAMDEFGGYCHVYDFKLTFRVVQLEDDIKVEFVRVNYYGQKERVCCGLRLKDYLEDTFWDNQYTITERDTNKYVWHTYYIIDKSFLADDEQAEDYSEEAWDEEG